MYSKAQLKILSDLAYSNSTSFKKISRKSTTKEFILDCIKENAFIVLKYFPYNFLDLSEEISKAMIKKNKALIEDIPYEHINYEMIKEVITADPIYLSSIPSNLMTRELYKIAISLDGNNLRHMPYELRDREICLLAIKNNIYALEKVPSSLKDKSFYEDAINVNKDIKRIMPKL